MNLESRLERRSRLMAALLAVALAAAGGCRKSFVEADAIYQDEVAKLDALESEAVEAQLAVTREFNDLARRNQLTAKQERYSALRTWLRSHPRPAGNEFDDADGSVELLADGIHADFLTKGQRATDSFSRAFLIDASAWWLADHPRPGISDLSPGDYDRETNHWRQELVDAELKWEEEFDAFMTTIDPPASAAPDQDKVNERAMKIVGDYKPLIAAQREKVEAAKKAKEAAK